MTFPSRRAFITCVRIYSDGACLGNPGPAAVGVVIYDDANNELEKLSRVVGDSTSNGAEYRALIEGLDAAAKHTRRRVECYSDSDVVIGQMTGRYRLREERLRRLFHEVKDCERPFEKVVYVRVRGNDQRIAGAHKLAHEALNGRGGGRR